MILKPIALTTDSTGLAGAVHTGVMVMLLVTLLAAALGVEELWRGERRTVPVEISLPSAASAGGLIAPMWLLLSDGLLN